MFNLNDYIVFQITPWGERIWATHEADLCRDINLALAAWAEPRQPRPLPLVKGFKGESGRWCSMQIHDFMRVFGMHLHDGVHQAVKDNAFAIHECEVPNKY
jgi:hypothetical protein